MVDTGASYTIVPAKLLKDLGVEPIDTVRLALANGRRVEYQIGRAVATVDGRTETTPVVSGKTPPARCWGPTPWRGCGWRWTR